MSATGWSLSRGPKAIRPRRGRRGAHECRPCWASVLSRVCTARRSPRPRAARCWTGRHSTRDPSSSPSPTPSIGTRPRPPGWATVYGEVQVSTGGAPAAWALVELTGAGTAYQTVSDERGRFLCYLPYPEALPVLAGSPPVGGGIGDVSWALAVTVNFEPASLAWPVVPGTGPPDIASIRAQSQAQISEGGNPQASIVATLSFGTPLLLRLGVVPA